MIFSERIYPIFNFYKRHICYKLLQINMRYNEKSGICHNFWYYIKT